MLKKTADIWGHPRPLPSLFFSQMWERFSFYGIQPIVALFMIATIHQGGLGFSSETVGAIMGIFTGSIYLFAIPSGWLADNWLGQKRAVWYGSVLIASGHLLIAMSYFFGHKCFFLGLLVIVLGSGLFKTSLVVLAGLLYKPEDKRRDAGFSIFYMGINLGGFISPLFTGLAADKGYWHLAFGIGGIGMLIALIVFRFFTMPSMRLYAEKHNISKNWEDKSKLSGLATRLLSLIAFVVLAVITLLLFDVITLNPVLISNYLVVIITISCISYFMYLFLSSNLSKAERANMLVCGVLLIASALFWAAFEQQPTSYNLFAEYYVDRDYMGFTLPTAWLQSVNPFFIILFAPVFGWLWVWLERIKKQPGYVIKFAIGLLLAGVGFMVMMFAAKHSISLESHKISVIWLILSLLFLTFGELALSPVGLAAMTSLVPHRIGAQMVGLWYAVTSVGSVIAGLIGGQVNEDNLQALPALFKLSAGYLLIAGCSLIVGYLIFTKLFKRFYTA